MLMRKTTLFSTAVLSMMGAAVAFTSCSSDDDVFNGGNNGNGNDAPQAIVLQVSNAGDGLTTRAGRPLLSAEAKQSIENVKVFICDASNNIVQDTLIANWNTGSDTYTTGGHGRKMTIMLEGHQKLDKNTNYTVYAVGYSTDSEYNDGGNKGIAALLATYGNGKSNGKDNATETVNTYNPQTSPLTLKTGHDEIFAGSATLSTGDKGFNQPVVLHRQVAGAFAYVDKIPFLEGMDTDSKLRLMATNKSTDLILDKFASSQLESNGKNTSNDVVNGYVATPGTNLVMVAEATLGDWFTAVENENGLVKVTGNWNTADKGNNYKEGSVFLGDFVVPFLKNTGVNSNTTFVLQLTKGNGDVLRSWLVRLPASETVAATVHYWNGTAWAEKNGEENKNHYSVMRNHLYGIGTKMADNGTDGGGGGENPDTPESLNNKQELTLQVNDNWEVIHKMEIE